MMRKVLDRIAIKLVLWLVFFSVVLTVVTTFGEVYIDYRQDRQRIAASLDNVTWQQLPDVAEGVLAGDSAAINSLLVQLVRSTGVAYAAVVVDDKVLWQQGRSLAGRGYSSRYPLLAPVGDNPPIGSLEVEADTKPMWHDLTLRFVRIIADNGIKIFLIAGFTLLMFQYLVTRHLESLAQQIHRLDFSKPGTPLRLDRKSTADHDELDQVVSGLNTMQERARQAYESLARNEQRLLLFFDSTEEAIIGVDRERVCTFANDAGLRMLGLTDYEDVIGKGIHELFVQSTMTNSAEASEECLVCQVIEQGRALQCDDGIIGIADGRSLFISLRAYPVFKNGNVSGALLFVNDNSEKRKLVRERELLSKAIEQVPVMIMIADAGNALQYVNGWVERLTGYSREELVGRPATFLEDLSATAKEKLAAVENRLKAGRQWEGMLETQSKFGQPLKFSSVISPVFDDRNRMVNTISVSREVSYEVALHNELIQAKKMEAVGRLSSSFAHEFGNPLFGVRSVLRDISDRAVLGEEDKALVELACRECERMRKMVREFQLLYRESTSLDELQPIDRIITGVLEEAGPLMTAHNVSLTLQMIAEAQEVVASRAKLALVMKNIVVNAIEAMSSTGGILQVGSALLEEFLVLSIGDGGAGIKKEYQELVFEPFFSTKPVVEGAGLGLSVAYGTMRSLGGTITFASEEGKGTCFNVHIPLV